MKAVIPTELEVRTPDKWGAGHYKAPRGKRTHNGIDYTCPAGYSVLAPVSGVVTKFGYPYGDDLSFKYIQISHTSAEGDYDHRIFYVSPGWEIGTNVKEGQVIGIAQDLTVRYPGITPHIHYEIKLNGEFINPNEFGSDHA